MTTTSAAAAVLAASTTFVPNAPARATAVIHAARLLLPALERGQPIDAAVLRAAMEHAAGASDSEGGWHWKSAYDACATLRSVNATARPPGSTAAHLSQAVQAKMEEYAEQLIHDRKPGWQRKE